uniref:U4-lycotoxin-Ls1d n=1 Tax=Lycosa singoriensis TaxID=434756 RepID=TX405_LYCSI|nr:RecName: Full=U4-lycotoxin-Ls1d; Short=U4-LCTX-Ls1d; AltName: Full=Toxin-like structure LSTX-C5; Flags: Precursor [Lycosa singoriensis]ACI41353.1 toxin-like structure LSTX-C5 precursor [Lycosa singoriensis]CAS03623.1 toxin-like structure LSTX-C5 precursor [Lycosa singoriensis]
MKVLVLFSVLFLTLFSYSSTEAMDEFDSDAEEDMLSLMANEQVRAKACTPRLHDCSHDRHSCCRGELFKDVCYCFYPEGEDKTEVCSCQQPKSHKYIEKVVDKARTVVG